MRKEREGKEVVEGVETKKYKMTVTSWEKAKVGALEKPGACPSSFKIHQQNQISSYSHSYDNGTVQLVSNFLIVKSKY